MYSSSSRSISSSSYLHKYPSAEREGRARGPNERRCCAPLLLFSSSSSASPLVSLPARLSLSLLACLSVTFSSSSSPRTITMSTRRVVVTASARGSGGAKGAATDSSLSTRFSKLKPTPQRALAIARDERRSVRATTSSNNRAAAIEARRQTGAPVTRGTKRGGARGGSRGGSRGGARGGSGARGGRGAGNTKKKASVHDLDKELDAYRSKDPKFLQAELDREIEDYQKTREAAAKDDTADKDSSDAADAAASTSASAE